MYLCIGGGGQEIVMKNKNFFLLKCIHVLITTILFYAFWLMFRHGSIHGSVIRTAHERYDYFTALGYVFVLCLFTRTYNSYLLGFTRTINLVSSQFMSQIFSLMFIYRSASNKIRCDSIECESTGQIYKIEKELQ